VSNSCLIRVTVGRAFARSFFLSVGMALVLGVGSVTPADAASSQQLNIQRSKAALPQSQSFQEPKKIHSLESVKPPRSGDFYEGGTKEAEYEHVLDEEIRTLYKLSQQNRKSPNRGEVWLRLGEQYVEKARLMNLREQGEFEKKMTEFNDRKTKVRPQLNNSASREYNEKAVQLYEWFIKDFPKDPKVDQALFFLGYNQFELGRLQLGERYYSLLVKNYPDSAFVTESHFALGEYYFENENWRKALDNYAKVVKEKRARLNTFALYKSAWCLYRLNRTKIALQALERVVRQSRVADREDGAAGVHKPVNKLRLGQEALKDYVPFYAEVGVPEKAQTDFQRMSGNEKQTQTMLERLAFIYADQGNRPGAKYVFKQLIALNPTGERSAEFQYQIVLSNSTHDQKEFRKELDIWLESFGPTSLWSKENASNQKLVADVAKLQETTLRNYVLQQHQAAQNSRALFSQNAALSAYNQYFKYFSNAAKAVEMQFFHAELLFDMEKYEEAARLYVWVAEKDSKGIYHEKAIVNSLLALEKDLPTPKQIEEKRGKSLETLPLDPPVQRFEKAAIRYIQAFPKGNKTNDIKRRLGVIYYGYNHFDEALNMFDQVIRENPKSENAEIAGNLTLDIYKLRGDMGGLSKKGREYLTNPQIASTKFGNEVRTIMAKAGYLAAEKMADSGDSLKAAKEFENFADSNKGTELGQAALYKAAVNYEKAGDLASASRMHQFVLAAPSTDPKIKAAQNDSQNALARIYQQSGQLDLAAKQYEFIAGANSKDPKAANAYFNAGVLYDSLGESGPAIRNYDAYFERSKKADRVEIIYAEAELLRHKGQLAKASTYYDKYLRAPRSQVHAIESTYMIAHIAEELGQPSKAKQWFKKTLEAFHSSNKSARDETVKYAAEARFVQAQDVLRELLAVKFTANDKQQARAAAQVKTLREKYINEMKDVIRFDNGLWIVAALTSSGQMFDSLARMFNNIPVPAGYKPDEAAQYKGLIQQQVVGLKADAANSYKAAVEKAHALEVYSSWSQLAQQGLAAQDPAGATTLETGEITIDARAADWMGL